MYTIIYQYGEESLEITVCGYYFAVLIIEYIRQKWGYNPSKIHQNEKQN